MTVPAEVQEWFLRQGYGEVVRVESIGGGCINNGARVHARSGLTFFLKTNAASPPEMFAREAEGLLALRTDDGPRFPEPLLWSQAFLLMEDLPPAPPGPDFWPSLGRRLAALHRHESMRFGFDHDNFIGSTPQPNPWTEDGFEFFGTHRLLFQAGLARESGRLSSSDLHRVETLAARLNGLVPRQPASLLHGDLWSGNVIPGPKGEACLIDPACHFGWAEAELGMTELFGALDPSFYDAYTDARPLPAGWRDRLPVYNLYHLLNHLNLFGSSYLPSVRRVLDRFA